MHQRPGYITKFRERRLGYENLTYCSFSFCNKNLTFITQKITSFMKRKLFITAALLSCSIFIMAVVADLNGKWKGVIKTPDGNELPVTYTFKADGDKLTGTAESPAGTVTVDDGTITGDTFKFKVTVDGNDYPHTGKMYADSCGIDIDFGGMKVHTTVTRDISK